MNGELFTETFEYDGGRQVTVYVPPDPPYLTHHPVFTSAAEAVTACVTAGRDPARIAAAQPM